MVLNMKFATPAVLKNSPIVLIQILLLLQISVAIRANFGNSSTVDIHLGSNTTCTIKNFTATDWIFGADLQVQSITTI